MVTQYKTLQTIYTITKDDSKPETYKCRPREIILRQFQEWNMIEQQLKLLEEEGLIITSQEDTLVVCITIAGIEKINSGIKSIAEN